MKAAGVLPFALFSATAINIFDDRTVPSSIKRTAPAGDSRLKFVDGISREARRSGLKTI
jgi:hypothetical protein